MDKREQIPNKAISGGIKILKPMNVTMIQFEIDMSLEGLKIGFLFLGRELIRYKVDIHNGDLLVVTDINPLTGETKAQYAITLYKLVESLDPKYIWFYTK